ncbi:MAG: alpha/beta fold hydrolase [Candidatus Alcyoniella australis]|nr:alpha/beta fold hydrolase [Candidatus Alcyoniella australis]
MSLIVWLIKLLLVLGAVWLSLHVLARFFARYYLIERRPDSVHYARTDDDWLVALHRFEPTKRKPRSLPLILCHGLGGNMRLYDFSDHASLCRSLADAGYDVWALELRGAGDSSKPDWLGNYSYHWDFNDYLRYDIPAAVRYVLKQTRKKKLHWIGHSMGGMLMYAYLQTQGAAQIATATAISSPGNLDQFKGISRLAKVVALLPVIRLARLTQFLAPLFNHSSLIGMITGIRLENMLPGQSALAAANCQSNIPVKLLNQFAQWVEAGEISDHKGGYSYTRNLQVIQTPFLFLASEGDMTALSGSVKFVYDAVSSKDKRYVLFGPGSESTAYGHVDILIGENAPTEVFPVIHEWLDQHI